MPILCVAVSLSPGFSEPAPVVGVLSYKADGAGADKAAAALYASIMAAARNESGFKTVRKNTNTIWYEYDTAETPSASHLSWYTTVCGHLRCAFLLMGRFSQHNGTTYIESRLFSVHDKKFVLIASEPDNFTEDRGKIASLIVKQLSLFYSGKLPFITNLKAARGSSFKHVSLSWMSNPAGDSAVIYRSQYEFGDFIKIGETDSNSFNDTSSLEGIKYWYQVRGVSGGTPGVPAVDFGYRKPEIPKGLTVSDMLDARDKPRPEPATPEERRKEKLHLRLFEKYYESYLMATFISIVGRFYINSGELLAYRDIRIQSWDPGNRTIYFEKPGIFAARFFSRRFFRFIRDMHDLHIPYDELLPRTIKNAVIFCVPSGEKEIREPDGRCRYIPNLEAVALGTEYTRDYEYWKSNTIFFATSEEGIYKRIREVQMRGY